MLERSEITGKTYNADDCVFFRNCIQSAKYISWGAELLDLFVDSQDKLVFCFSRKDHDKFKERWGTKYNNKNSNRSDLNYGC